MGVRLAKGEEKHKIERKGWETNKGWETRVREVLSSLVPLFRLNNACYRVLVATEVRRRESRVELPFPGIQAPRWWGKRIEKKLRENRVRAGGRRGGLLAAARLSALTKSMAQARVMGFWHMLTFLETGRLWYTYLLQ